MKNIIIFAIILFCISCGEKETTPIPFISFINMPTDSAVLQTNKTYNFSTNLPNTIWRLTRGSVNNNNEFLAPNVQGKILLTAINPSDTNNKIYRTFYISSYKNLFDSMAQGGYVLNFRHAAASDGSDIFTSTVLNWWQSCSNTLARQLTAPTGYTQSTELGLCMRLLKLPIERIISSEYCRCKTTAELFAIPNVAVTLNQNITYYVYNEANRYTNQMSLINSSTSTTNKNTIIVGHAGYSNSPSPVYLGNLNWGDAAIFKTNPSSAATYVTTLLENDFRLMLQ